MADVPLAELDSVQSIGAVCVLRLQNCFNVYIMAHGVVSERVPAGCGNIMYVAAHELEYMHSQ